MNLKHSLGLVVIGLLLICAQSATNYTFVFDTQFGDTPSFNLGYLGANYSVLVNLTSTASGANSFNLSNLALSVALYDISNNYAATACNLLNTTSSSFVATAYSTVYICNTTSSSNYYLVVELADYPVKFTDRDTPVAAADVKALQYYQITVTSYLNSTGGPSNSSAVVKNHVKATDTVRNQVVKLIYLNQSAVNISLFPVPVDLSTIKFANVSLIPIKTTPSVSGSAYDFTGQTPVTLVPGRSTSDSTTFYFNGSVSAVGYYLLAVKYQLFSGFSNFVQVTYPSEVYTCPYSSAFPDLKGNFQPCGGSSSGLGSTANDTTKTNVPGFPCISFNNVTNKCTVCANGYTLSDFGICLYNTQCPPRQYFHFGTCSPVDPSCDGFNAFTGDCTSCVDPLKIVVDGKCVFNKSLIVNCTTRQYKVNNKCLDVNPLCGNFDPVTGGCTSCIDGYELSVASASCFPKRVVCNANQYLKNGVCVDIPQNCIFDSATQKCASCAFGFYVNNGACEKIVCAAGKVPSKYGIFCIDVNPSCNQDGQFDPLTGECLKCKEDGYTIQNGVCVQNLNPLSGCAARQALGFGACVNAQTNCQSYNLLTSNCESCQLGFAKDYTGVCTLPIVNTGCRGDQITIQGYCVQRPANCLIVDSLGLCTTCNGSQFQLQNGQCVKQTTCDSGQYLGAEGKCINVPAACTGGAFNPSTGECLTCNNGSPAVNGLCCSGNQVAFAGQCVDPASYNNIVSSIIDSDVPTCIGFHPSLGFCLECNAPFLPDPTVPGGCQ